MRASRWFVLLFFLLFAGCGFFDTDEEEESGGGGGGTPKITQPTVEITSEGTVLKGANLASKLAWLDRSAESHNTYIVEVSANENIAPYTFWYSGAINVTVIIRGDGTNRTIRLSKNGTMFKVNSDVTLILDNNITLQGHSGNSGSMVYVSQGTFKMNDGATITGNYNGSTGGGVYNSSGTFTMNGGTIIGNTANYGGGVYNSSGTFTMNGGTIMGNTANDEGGGVRSSGGTFTMRGGTISDNTASQYGGGVYINSFGTFNKTGGIITGYNSDQINGNKVADGYVLSRRGHAVYNSTGRVSGLRKETTAGTEVNLSSENVKEGWDE